MVDIWREQGAVSVFTRFHPLLDNARIAPALVLPPDPHRGSGGVVEAGSTVSIDLTLDLKSIRAHYGRDVRRRINVARRAAVATSRDLDWASLTQFAARYRSTMERVGASEFHYFGESHFERLRAALGDRLHLLVTRSEGAMVAAGLFTEFEGTVEWYLGVYDRQMRGLSPNRVLLDDAIQWARERGNRVLHIGGGLGGREDSLFWFKTQFSRRRHRFHIGGWILDDNAYDGLVRARQSSLPNGTSLQADFFPAYRAATMPGESTVSR